MQRMPRAECLAAVAVVVVSFAFLRPLMNPNSATPGCGEVGTASTHLAATANGRPVRQAESRKESSHAETCLPQQKHPMICAHGGDHSLAAQPPATSAAYLKSVEVIPSSSLNIHFHFVCVHFVKAKIVLPGTQLRLAHMQRQAVACRLHATHYLSACRSAELALRWMWFALWMQDCSPFILDTYRRW